MMACQLSEAAQTKFNALLDAFDAFRVEISSKSHLDHGFKDIPDVKSLSGGDNKVRARLDAEITALQEMDLQIQKQLSVHLQMLNMLSPMHRLPSEITLGILKMVWQQGSKEDSEFSSYRKIELVCHHWWNLLRSTPLVSAEAPTWWNEHMIATSGDTPLNIVWDNFDESFLRLVEPHVQRWGTVRGTIVGHEAWKGYFLRAAPLLRSFSLETHLPRSIFHSIVNLFGGTAPRLMRLEIPQIGIPWDSGLLNGLRSLHIPAFNGTVVFHNSNIRKVLEASPDLQEFVLTGHTESLMGMGPGYLEQQPPYGPDIHEGDHSNLVLPHLRLLHLLYTPAHTTRFVLDTIQAPLIEEVHVDIKVLDEPAMIRIFDQLPVDCVITSTTSASFHNNMKMVVGGEDRELFEFRSIESTIKSDTDDTAYPFRVRIFGFERSLPTTNPLFHIRSLFPSWIPATRELELYDSDLYNFPADYGLTVQEILCEFTSLKKMVLSHDGGHKSSILRALGSPARGRRSLSLGWACPKLTHLELSGTRWFILPELRACLDMRYGNIDFDGLGIVGLELPVRLEKLVIGEESFLDFNFGMEEIIAIVGSDVVEQATPFNQTITHVL